VLQRLAAWLVTGPAGHLWAGVADWAVLVARWLRGRAHRRWGGARGSRDA
jgi:hypothetical protein